MKTPIMMGNEYGKGTINEMARLITRDIPIHISCCDRKSLLLLNSILCNVMSIKCYYPMEKKVSLDEGNACICHTPAELFLGYLQEDSIKMKYYQLRLSPSVVIDLPDLAVPVTFK
jgi:hypothetical protein